MSDGMLFRYGKKKENIWVHKSCIRWFEYYLEKDENGFCYLNSNVKDFLDYLTSECCICKKTKKGDFLINCSFTDKTGSNCDNNFYHKSCLLSSPYYVNFVDKIIVENKYVYYAFKCPDHSIDFLIYNYLETTHFYYLTFNVIINNFSPFL